MPDLRPPKNTPADVSDHGGEVVLRGYDTPHAGADAEAADEAFADGRTSLKIDCI